jgi:hypothetical protein
MIHSAPCTAGELQDYVDKHKIPVKHCWKLLSQLRDLGVLYEKQIRNCNITGRMVIEWDLTDKLPINSKVVTHTKKDRVNNTLIALRELYNNKFRTDEDWKKVAGLIKSI